MTPREAGAAREVPEVPEAPRSPSPRPAAALWGPGAARQGREATASRYRGPELCNYHGRPSYFGKRLRRCQSFYSSKPKQDGKSPAQDAASGGSGEVNPLPPHCPHRGGVGGRCLLPPCLHPASLQHQGGSGGLWLHQEGVSKERGGNGGRFGVIQAAARHGMGLGWGGGSAPSSAAGRFRGRVFGCFSASAVRTAIFSSFCRNGSSFGAFPARRLGRGMLARAEHLTAAPNKMAPGDKVPAGFIPRATPKEGQRRQPGRDVAEWPPRWG